MNKKEEAIVKELYNRTKSFNSKHGINAEAIDFVKGKVKELYASVTDAEEEETSDLHPHLDASALASNFPKQFGKAKESEGETMLSTDPAENEKLNANS